MTIRSPAVAGMFYPERAVRLRHNVETMLEEAPQESIEPRPKALIVPHAGYVYSGPVAARAYRLLERSRQIITRVVLLGPAHRVFLEGMAVPTAEAFATPLGEIPLDLEAIGSIAELPGVQCSDAAHGPEHSLEVQLPFLQTVLGTFDLVPLVVGRCDADRVAAVIDTLWGGPETLIVVSSDLSHYLSYSEAREIDGHTCRRILEKESTLSGEEACGAHAINGLMRARHSQQMEVEAIDVRNSGDTAGDKRRVVGYGAFVLH